VTVAETEEAITGQRRTSLTLGQAFAVFRRYPSPWVLTALLVASVTYRVIIGGVYWRDALVVAVALAAFPFFEWVTHVVILHWRPRRIAGVKIDPLLSRKHREHHADPRDVPLIFIPWKSLIWIVPFYGAIGLFAFPDRGLGMTYLVVIALLGINYEWIHFLVHSDYKPKTRFYRAIWRHHRWHHYKNEHYWFGVSTAGVSDKVLHTAPDPATVRTSPTVRALHAREAG
jgi:hypothetical protein